MNSTARSVAASWFVQVDVQYKFFGESEDADGRSPRSKSTSPLFSALCIGFRVSGFHLIVRDSLLGLGFERLIAGSLFQNIAPRWR